MLDPAGDAKRSNYSREDDSTRRLWLTQRTKANPWDHRTPNPDEEEAAGQPQARQNQGRKPEPAPPTLIPQTDRLSLQPSGPQTVENPFAALIVHRLGLDPD